MDTSHRNHGGFFGLGITAALSVLILLGATAWKITDAIHAHNETLSVSSTGSTDRISATGAQNPSSYASTNNGSSQSSTATAADDPYAPAHIGDNVASVLAADYQIMQKSGTYTAEQKAHVAQALGANLKASVAYKSYTSDSIKTDRPASDTSYARMLTYRTDLQSSLASLMKNTTPEIDLLTKYVQTNDPTYLTEIQKVSGNYKLAVAKTALVVAPGDAGAVHIGILNAMQEFAATLDQMVASANDPFTEATLINTYMQAQQDMFSSFNNLYGYYKSKQV